MSQRQIIRLPQPTVDRLEKVILQIGQLQAVVDASLATAGEALGVPPDYILRSIATGFEPPELVEPESHAVAGQPSQEEPETVAVIDSSSVAVEPLSEPPVG